MTCLIQLDSIQKKLCKLLQQEELRILFLKELNKYRGEGVFLINKETYEILVLAFTIIINISKDKNDYKSIELCMILSTTFFYLSSNGKIFIHKEISKNKIWEKKEFWKNIIQYFINDDINCSKNYSVFFEEDEEGRSERVKSAASGQLLTFLFNMKLFNITLKERKEIANFFFDKYKIVNKDLFEEELELSKNEINNEIVEESASSNLIIEPEENSNNNKK